MKAKAIHVCGRGLGGGFRDDRISLPDGKWLNGAMCWICNSIKGSSLGHYNDDYMPQNKPASTVTLRDYYITIVGDLDDDRNVDIADLAMFCDYWLEQNYVGWPDFNNDKNVDFRDFALLAANWQQSIPPP